MRMSFHLAVGTCRLNRQVPTAKCFERLEVSGMWERQVCRVVPPTLPGCAVVDCKTGNWKLLDELPRLDDGAKPRVKRLQRRFFVEETAVHKPHFAGVAELCVGAVERGSGGAIYRDICQIIANTRRNISFEALCAYLWLAVRHYKELKALRFFNILECNGGGASPFGVFFHRKLLRIEKREMIPGAPILFRSNWWRARGWRNGGKRLTWRLNRQVNSRGGSCGSQAGRSSEIRERQRIRSKRCGEGRARTCINKISDNEKHACRHNNRRLVLHTVIISCSFQSAAQGRRSETSQNAKGHPWYF